MDSRGRFTENHLNDFYITLRNTDSTKYYPKNTTSHFRVKLQNRLRLPGQWKVGLTEFFIDKKKKEVLYICSNITSCYRLGGSLSSALRVIPKNEKYIVFESPYYLEVDGDEYDMIEIYITDATGNFVSFDDEEVTCTLHFKKTF